MRTVRARTWFSVSCPSQSVQPLAVHSDNAGLCCDSSFVNQDFVSVRTIARGSSQMHRGFPWLVEFHYSNIEDSRCVVVLDAMLSFEVSWPGTQLLDEVIALFDNLVDCK